MKTNYNNTNESANQVKNQYAAAIAPTFAAGDMVEFKGGVFEVLGQHRDDVVVKAKGGARFCVECARLTASKERRPRLPEWLRRGVVIIDKGDRLTIEKVGNTSVSLIGCHSVQLAWVLLKCTPAENQPQAPEWVKEGAQCYDGFRPETIVKIEGAAVTVRTDYGCGCVTESTRDITKLKPYYKDAEKSPKPQTDETKRAARLEEGARVLCIHYGIFGTIDHHNTRDGKITYVVKYDEPQRRADGSTFQFEEYDREGITTNYDPTKGKEIEGNAQHYRETLCASWWGGDDVPRLFEFGGLNLVCIRKGEYWDLTTDDGKGTQHDLTLDELADVLAQYYTDDQKAQAARVA